MLYIRLDWLVGTWKIRSKILRYIKAGTLDNGLFYLHPQYSKLVGYLGGDLDDLKKYFKIAFYIG